jgi:hypothetical protein
VQIYDYAGATATHQTSVTTDTAHQLPPREIAWY